MRRYMAVLLVLCLSVVAIAGTGRAVGYLLLDTSKWTAGVRYFQITTDAGGNHTVVPLSVTQADGSTTPGPVVPISSSLSQTVQNLTSKVNDPEKVQNAAGLSVIYSIVGSKVADGKATGAEGLAQLKKLTDGFLKARSVEANWKAWRVGVGAALTAERTAGRLTTDAQHAAALTTIADSLAGDGRALAKIEKRKGKIKLKGLIKVLLAIFADGGDFDFATILKLILGILG